MAARYYRVSPRFWTDTRSWTEDARLLGLYLLTCPHRTTEGLFRLPKAYIYADLGWTVERLGEPFAELLANGFIHYDETLEIVLITNALKYQAPENPNQVKHAISLLEELPPTPLFSLLTTVAKRFSEPLAKGLEERFGEGFGKPQSLTQAQSHTQENLSSSNELEQKRSQRKLSAAEQIASDCLSQALTKSPELLDWTPYQRYEAAFLEAWSRAAREDTDPKTAGVWILARYFNHLTDKEPDFPKLRLLVKSFGHRALLGVQQSVTRGIEDWYPYARKVCDDSEVTA